MLKWHGFAGIVMILFAELVMLLKIEPFASWYFPVIWIGFILTVDAIVFSIKKDSMFVNRPQKLCLLYLLSVILWWFFEILNIYIKNWYYVNAPAPAWLFASLSFGTVIPAVFEVKELLQALKPFNVKGKKGKISRRTICIMIVLGIVSMALPIIWPGYFFPLIWGALFLLLDPINYLNGNPSIIGHIAKGSWRIPLAVFFAGYICGIFWEFWNYWAIPKWHYTIPFVSFLKVFEMPILGYLGYGPFALELYATWHFVKGIGMKKKKIEKG
jgi:hypothetical protein